MFHHRHSLLLGTKPGEHVLRRQFGFDQLEGDTPLDWLVLFGQPDDTHSASSDFFNQAEVGQLRWYIIRNGDRPVGLLEIRR